MSKKEFIISFTIDVLTTAQQTKEILTAYQDQLSAITLCSNSNELMTLDVEYSEIEVTDLKDVEGAF